MSWARTASGSGPMDDDDSVSSLPKNPASSQWHQKTPTERFLHQDEDLTGWLLHRATTDKPTHPLSSSLSRLSTRVDAFVSTRPRLRWMCFFSTHEQEISFHQKMESFLSYLRVLQRSRKDSNTAITEYAESLIHRLLDNFEAAFEELVRRTETFRVEDVKLNAGSFLTEKISYYISELQSINLNDAGFPNSSTDNATRSKVSALEERSRQRPKTMSEREGLIDWLLSVRTLSAVNDAPYLPLDALEKVLSRHVVEKELRNKGISKRLIREYVARICGFQPLISTTRKRPARLLKIFAILVLINETRSIELFIQNDVHDYILPFTTSQPGPYLPVPRKHQVLLLNSIGKNFAQRFIDMQPLLLAPYFELTVHQQDPTYINHYDLPFEAPLPFTIMNYDKGNRRSITIHHGQYNRDDCARAFCKNHDIFTLIHSDDSGFQLPLALRSHNQIIQPILTFNQNERKYAIIPYIKDDIEGFLKADHPTADAASQWARWVVYQSKGLAEGISIIHDMDLSISLQTSLPSKYRYKWNKGISQETILWLDGMEFGDRERNKGRLGLFYERNNIFGTIQHLMEEDLVTKKIMDDVMNLGCLLFRLVVWCYEGRLGVEQLSHEELELRSSPSLSKLDDEGTTTHLKKLYERVHIGMFLFIEMSSTSYPR